MDYREKRRKLLEDLLGGECINCGKKDGLQFDHVFPEEQSFKIATYLRCSLKKVLPELQKCQLLCFNCHWEKSRTETATKLKPMKHGITSTYTNRSCRCKECTKAWAIYRRPYQKGYRLKKVNNSV